MNGVYIYLAARHVVSPLRPDERGEIFVSDSIPQRSEKYRFGRQKWFDSFSLDHVFSLSTVCVCVCKDQERKMQFTRMIHSAPFPD